MPLKDRRAEYSWPETVIKNFMIQSDKKEYKVDENIKIKYSFELFGGLRDSFSPDVWTVAWEDYDKFIRLHYYVSLKEKTMIIDKKLAETGKRVRKASFYWSRDPDLPYRIWTMIIPEDGGAPIIPDSVNDAKKKMFSFGGSFTVASRLLGKRSHRVYCHLDLSWFRRSFIEKGRVESNSNLLVIEVS